MRFRFPILPRPAVRHACIALALAASGLAAVAADTAPPPIAPLAADETVFDHSQVEWSESYLQWIATFARDSSPVSDTSGAQCAAKQAGDVWFLASSDGTAPVVRACAIPAGKTLFVPIVSTMERSGNRDPNCQSMARLAAAALARVSRLAMTIDGRPVDDLQDHRLASGDCFALDARQASRSTSRTTVADGYYVMLPPLPPGPHTIAAEARFDGTSVSTTYRLDVR